MPHADDAPGTPGPSPHDGTSATGETSDGASSRATKAPGRRRRRSKLRVLLYTLLALLLIVALVIGGFFLYLKYVFDSNVSREKLLPSSNVTRDAAAGDAQNILLLGSDSRNTSLRDGSRSDVIQLVHISNDRKQVSVVHFPRDYYVDIPGHGKNKINAAYAYGGPTLFIQTIEKATNVHIDHVAQIGFKGFEKLTDDMGGVDIYVPQAFDEKGYGSWSKGMNHMNGTQARHYVQERHQLKNGDIDRGKNQQAWILAMFKKAKTQGVLTNPVTITKLVGDISDNLAVDDGFTSGYMTSLAYSLRDLDTQNITFYTAPYTGFGNEGAAGSVDYVDEAGLEKLSDGLRKDDMSGVPNGRVGAAS